MGRIFLSTPSARRATQNVLNASNRQGLFLSTPSARRATTKGVATMCRAFEISIHALREEGDSRDIEIGREYIRFLSTPSARRATRRTSKRFPPCQFLSTPSARRATLTSAVLSCSATISIHALREEGDFQGFNLDDTIKDISIHALREEGDLLRSVPSKFCRISIHALREEGDSRHKCREHHENISIHALREEGDVQCERPGKAGKKFLSTPSARRATGLHGF